jgi:putative Mg2+ transporter-C (MgtC) family protein
MIISGIGFLCAGIIIFRETNVTGLTTASGLWVAAGIGLACGAGFYVPAFIATLLALFVFIVLWHVEREVKAISSRLDPDQKRD